MSNKPGNDGAKSARSITFQERPQIFLNRRVGSKQHDQPGNKWRTRFEKFANNDIHQTGSPPFNSK